MRQYEAKNEKYKKHIKVIKKQNEMLKIKLE